MRSFRITTPAAIASALILTFNATGALLPVPADSAGPADAAFAIVSAAERSRSSYFEFVVQAQVIGVKTVSQAASRATFEPASISPAAKRSQSQPVSFSRETARAMQPMEAKPFSTRTHEFSLNASAPMDATSFSADAKGYGLTPVPEPTTIALLVFGALAAIVWLARTWRAARLPDSSL